MKKGLRNSVVFLSLVIFFGTFISAGTPEGNQYYCGTGTVQQCNDVGATILMKFSSMNDSHAQNRTITPAYNYALCCNMGWEGNDIFNCDSTGNKIVRISVSTNAHGEIPAGTTQGYTNVCYKGVKNCGVCNADDANCVTTKCYGENKVMTISLSASTNAHFGAIYGYPIGPYFRQQIVCCEKNIPVGIVHYCGDGTVDNNPSNDYGVVEECEDGNTIDTDVCNNQCLYNEGADAFWSNSWGGDENSSITLERNSGIAYVRMVGYNLAGTNYNVTIYEEDDSSSNIIESMIVQPETGEIHAPWTITQTDLDKTPNDYDEFYFVVKQGDTDIYNPVQDERKYLALNLGEMPLLTCDQLLNATSCNSAIFEIANRTLFNSGVTNCGKSLYNLTEDCYYAQSCYCKWNATRNVCEGGKEARATECGEDLPDKIGSCGYDSSATSDTCEDDGMLNYSYHATFVWDIDNAFGTNVTACTQKGNNFRVDETGVCRLDPLEDDGVTRYSSTCVSDEKVIPCPGQVLLPFFDWLQLIVAVLVVGVIYFLVRKKNVQKTRRKKKR